jgi:hypothetical protein
MSQRLEIRYTDTTSSSIGGNYLRGMYSYYMSRYGRRMSWEYSGKDNPPVMYKFNGMHAETRILVKKKKSVKNNGFITPDVDMSRLVILGGVFEKVGGKDEAVGGGNQKVGSDNKR